jgi:4,5:9,10-diseco-3-hydroxy-5,9,17-trioxoandrosta-1(10),2-diene-4-oate hydrolase
VLPGLVSRFRTIVIDDPGYGQSEELPVADSPRNVALHIAKLLDVIGVESLTVVGHSKGGRIACELAFEIGARVRRLIVVCAGSVAPRGHLTDDGEWTESALALVSFGADGDLSLETFKEAYRTTVARPESMPDELLEALYDEFDAEQQERYIARIKAFDPLVFYHEGDAAAFQARLRGLEIPVSVIWGREDTTSSYHRAVDLLEVIPDVELHILPGCGHFPQRERPEVLAQLIADFAGSPDGA